MKKRLEELEKKVEYLLKYAKLDKELEQKDIVEEAKEALKTSKMVYRRCQIFDTDSYQSKKGDLYLSKTFNILYQDTPSYFCKYKGKVIEDKIAVKTLYDLCEWLHG